jgi:predicted Zn-dependent peptidase
MENAIFREFMPERDVVREERRMRYDDSPYGRYFESLIATFYEEHPYRIPTIGWPSDIENLSKAQITEHYKKYYKPNNAILVLAGNFESKKTLAQIERYFGNISKGEEHATLTIEEPTQIGAKRLVQYKGDAKPRYDLLFQAPEVGHKDAYALEVLAGVLSGQGGRLYRRLVEKEGLALGTDAGLRAQKYISSFEIDVNLKPGLELSKVNRIEEIVWEEIQKIQRDGVNEKELLKVRNQALASSVRAFEGLEHAANQLAFNELYGSWKLVQDWPVEIGKITASDVKRVANQYLKYHRSTTGQMLEPGQRPVWQSEGIPQTDLTNEPTEKKMELKK